jgi:hypothetical protein
VSESPTLTDLLDDGALMSFEHQEHLIEVLGEHRWDVTFDPPRLAFSGDHPLVCTRFHLLGSAAPGPQSWLWSWANPTNYRPEVTALAASLRDFGLEHGIPELANGEIPFTELPGSPTDPLRVTWLMGELAKSVSGNWTLYMGDAGRGTRIGMLVEHPDFTLPEPGPSQVMRIMREGIASLQLPDHKRALHSYAVRRGLDFAFNEDRSTMSFTWPGVESVAVIAFDERGRVTRMYATERAES